MSERDNRDQTRFNLAEMEKPQNWLGGMLIVRNLDEGLIIEGVERIVLRDVGMDGVTVAVGRLSELEHTYKERRLAWDNLYYSDKYDGTILVDVDKNIYSRRARFFLKFPREVQIDRDEIYARKFVEENEE